MLTHDMCLIMFTLIAKNCNLTDILENKTGAQVGSQDRFQYIIKKDFFNSLSSLKNKLQFHEAITSITGYFQIQIFSYNALRKLYYLHTTWGCTDKAISYIYNPVE